MIQNSFGESDNMKNRDKLEQLREALNAALSEVHSLTSAVKFEIHEYNQSIVGREYELPIISVEVFDKIKIARC